MLALLLLSSCYDQKSETTACAEPLIYRPAISGTISPIATQNKLSIDGEVVYDSCEQIQKELVYPYNGSLIVGIEKINVDEITIELEGKEVCEDDWQTLIPSTVAPITWSVSTMYCTSPTEYGSFSVQPGS